MAAMPISSPIGLELVISEELDLTWRAFVSPTAESDPLEEVARDSEEANGASGD